MSALSSLRLSSLATLPLAALLAAALVANCGGKSDPPAAPTDDAGSDGGDEVDAPAIDGDAPVDGPAEAGDAPLPDAGPDTAPKPVTCTKAPDYGIAALRLNHNPDALRPVANGTVAMLPDGKLMVVFLEALDTGTRYGLYGRIVDPAGASGAGTVGPDVRLDVDADALSNTAGLTMSTLGNGALVMQYWPSGRDERHLRLYSHGKWSPELSSTMALANSDVLTFAGTPDGTVLVARAHGATPRGAATVYRPDEGGTFGSWSAVQTLDLDGGSGTPMIEARPLDDGRYLALVWDGSGGPSVRVRSVSGAWTAPGAKAEIGAVDTSPAVRLLADGTLVLVALEASGTGDVRRAVTSVWTSAGTGWSTARLLSKTVDANGVVPFVGGRADPFLFRVDRDTIEFVAWVAGCTGPAKACEFHPIERKFTAGAWGDPVDLAIGTPSTGADGLAVTALSGASVVVSRTSSDGSSVQLRARREEKDFSALTSILDGSPLFGSGVDARAEFFGGPDGLWAIAARTSTAADSGPPPELASAAGKITPGGTTAWGVVVDGASAAMSGFTAYSVYADGAGELTIAVSSASDGSSSFPIIGHAPVAGGALEVQRVVLADETSASFVNAPRSLPRGGGVDKSAIFAVTATPTGGTTGGKRLRAYAWNGIGGVSPKLLANETRAPRPFAEGLLTYGCGGAILYAVDPADGSHALEMVLVQ